jgi:glycosyltransferase involved in cell wall biosynthesis
MFSKLNPDPPRNIATTPIGWSDTAPNTYQSQHKSLCLITNSGIAPKLESLVHQLAAAGWNVTVLDCAAHPIPPHSASIATISYTALRQLHPTAVWYPPVQAAAAYHWLRTKLFDLVLCYHDCGGGFFVAMARRLGLIAMPVVALLDRPHAMRLELNCQFPTEYSDYEINYLEQQTAALANGVLLADAEVLTWLAAVHWALPEPVGLMNSVAQTKTDLMSWLVGLPAHVPANDTISITVCLATYNRPHFLRQALQSLERQSIVDFHVIVMDDGSTDPGVEQVRQDYAPLFTARGWLWQKQHNTGPAAARNAAAKLATTSHILFMDDDNIACQDELERLSLAARSGVPIINCLMGLHPESIMSFAPVLELADETDGTPRPLGWIPLGGALELAVFVNRIGDTNSLFQRDVFWQLGGFQGSRAMVFEDFTLLQRALLAGHSVMTIPEILVLYRRNADSRSMGSTIFTSHLESLLPLAEQVPAALHPLLLHLRKGWYDRHSARRTDSIKPSS